MASVKKFPEAAVEKEIRHNKRQIKNPKNKDIDPTRSHLNESLTPLRSVSEYEYYKQRKAELYCYHRADVKTLAGWIVTAPKELESPTDIKQFFSTTADFLTEKYGIENVISIDTHYDEGKMEKCKDRWTGEYLTDEDGTVKQQLVLGRPHLHFLFIPVVPDKNSRHVQSEKICCSKVLTQMELKKFHSSLKDYLTAHGCPGADGVLNGSTRLQGRNYSVEEMKEHYETQRKLEELLEIKRKYELEIEHTRTLEPKGW